MAYFMSNNWKFLLKKALYCYWYTIQILFCDLFVIFMLFCRIILKCIIMAETEKVLKCKWIKNTDTTSLHSYFDKFVSEIAWYLNVWMYSGRECGRYSNATEKPRHGEENSRAETWTRTWSISLFDQIYIK